MNETYLALDLGGTKLLIGELDSHGEILRHKRYEAHYSDQQEATKLIKRSLDDYISSVGFVGNPPVAMGVGLVGRVNPDEGIWMQIDPKRTIPVPLAAELSRHTGIPCHIDNDVKSAAQAVRRFELESDDFIYINVGTGIAACPVVSGRLIRGSHFNAGEVGHTAVGVNLGIKCGCGRDECVELIAAGIGFDRCARLLAPLHNSPLNIPTEDSERVDVREVYALSRAGDPLCTELVDNAATALAGLVMNLVRVTDPDTVVLGGGMVSDGYMYEKMLEKLNPTTIRFVTNGVVLTRLDPDFIGLKGACAVAINNYNNDKR